jgi:cyclic pyranopterin phosphate synthase
MIRIPHLETDVTQACQLSCVACNHHVPLWRSLGPWQAQQGQVEQDLNQLATILHSDRWGALGGEPLLHRQLVEILQIARASKIADKTEVWTNGLLLPKMSPEFWTSFDILVLSVYPGKHDEESLQWIAAQCQDSGVELVVKDERRHPNFRTLLEQTPTNALETRQKFAGCFFRSFSRVANYGYFFTCCCAPHMPMLIQGRPFGSDGVRIADLTEDTLVAYLNRTEPLGACTNCAGRDTAISIPWSEQRKPADWLAASAGATL